jgi:hypothetical protein
METVELDDPEPGPPPGPGAGLPWGLWVALGLAGLIGAFVLLGRTGTADQPPTPVVSSAPAILQPPPGPGQRQYLGVTAICGIATDHRTRLSVTFEVSNVSRYDVSIDTMRSVLPLDGLRPQPVTSGGNCAKPGRAAVPGLLGAGRTRYFTAHFALPKTCPAPYPVFVRINFRAGGFSETSFSILENDLAVPDFDACPVTTTLPQPKLSD